MFGFVLSLLISMIVSFGMAALIKGQMLGGRWTAFLITTLGAWVGGYMDAFRALGPKVDRLNLIGSIVGAIIFAVLFAIFKKSIEQIKI